MGVPPCEGLVHLVEGEANERPSGSGGRCERAGSDQLGVSNGETEISNPCMSSNDPRGRISNERSTESDEMMEVAVRVWLEKPIEEGAWPAMTPVDASRDTPLEGWGDGPYHGVPAVVSVGDREGLTGEQLD